MKISQIIELSPAFSAEVNVQRDFDYNLKGKNVYLDGYLPNVSSRHIMRQLFESLSFRDSEKVHLIMASYGTGKSYLLLIMAYLLGVSDQEAFTELRKKIEDKEDTYNDGLSSTLKEYWQSVSEYLIVIPDYGTDDFNQSMLAALNLALLEKKLIYRPKTNYLRAAEALESWQHNNPDLYAKFESKVNTKTGRDFIELLRKCDGSSYESFKLIFQEFIGSEFSESHGDIYQAFSDTAQHIMSKGYKGIVILHDEFGGVLDKLVNKTAQTPTLKIQGFLEQVKGKVSNANIIFIAASHQEPSTIQQNKLEDIKKVNGRFVRHKLVIEDAESEELMGKVFITRDTLAKDNLISTVITEDLLEQTENFSLYDGRSNAWITEKIIKGLYPLHPLTAFVLPKLSNQFAQNNRSMFNFLSPKEIRAGGLKKYIEETNTALSREKLNLYTPDMLLVFFEENLADSRSENVASLVDAYRTTLGKREDPIIKRVLENILVLTAARKEQIQPSFEVLLWAMDTVQVNDLQELMNSLVNDEILELNQNGVYEFPTFGSRSLGKIIAEEKSKLGTLTLSESKIIWTEVNGPVAYVFDEHNDTYGSNRSFRTIWINHPDELETYLGMLLKNYRWESKETYIQGFIIYLLSNDENDLEAYQKKTGAYTDVLKYTIFAFAKSADIFDKILSRTTDFMALTNAERNIEVSGNANHVQKVKADFIRLRAELTTQIRNLFEPVNWLWSFAELTSGIEIKSRAFDNRMEEYINELFTTVLKIKDDALWFTKPRREIGPVMSDILSAEKNRLPLANLNNQSVSTRITTNFFQHLKLTTEVVTVNKIHYGELKVPDSGSAAEAVFKLIDKTLKVDQLIPASDFVKPLLQAPFGLSETVIKYMFTCFLRANKENLLLIDPKRPAQALDKDSASLEELLKPGSSYRIRKIEMSTFEIRYLKQLNGLFGKDAYANDFGELSKRFEGLMNFLSPLHWALFKRKQDVEHFYLELLQPFLLEAASTGVDREKLAREFFMVTLPGLFLQMASKEEFGNDNDNIPKLIAKLKVYKEYPHAEETAFKDEIIKTVSNSVFKSSISTIDDFRDVVSTWFSGLSYTIKSLAVFEDQSVMTWVKKMRSPDPVEVAKFYLEELATPSVKEWTNLGFQTHQYVATIEKYKTQIETYTRSPLVVYQSIARACFSMSANDCPTEEIFKETFQNWWDKLSPLTKAPHFEQPLVNIFVEEYQTVLTVKEKFLTYIPAKWTQAGLIGVINPQWEEWSSVEVSVIAEEYGNCVKALNAWRPPILEEALCQAIAQCFDLVQVDNFEALQNSLTDSWVAELPDNTKLANWPEGSLEASLLTAIQQNQIRTFFLETLPASFGLREFKYWDQQELQQYEQKLSALKSTIDDYKRPLLEVVAELGKKLKIKADSLAEFRVQLRESLRSTEAYRFNAGNESGLLSDERAIPFLDEIRKLNSDDNLFEMIGVMAVEFKIERSYDQWSASEQSLFVKAFQEVFTYLQKWKYPKDTRMDEARLKLNAEVEAIEKSAKLSKSQIVKVLRDVLSDQINSGE
ncbi:hypothetical protein ACJVDH_09870 [Pedobacter sp. AW1-32]|uniref:hypothetical protein n=1 Tax=Pedobacter sp. AW1-32 TaxID=3383026 RepID=UPI003FF103A1